MFTGIIEALGVIRRSESRGSNRNFLISSDISQELKVDQSVSHDGVCLTVTEVISEGHWVTAVEETLGKSNLSRWKDGTRVNLERSMLNNGRFDGHIVQGHVDQVATVTSIRNMQGSWVVEFSFDPAAGNVTVEKGSIAVNGVSLTCFNSTPDSFSVAIIPYTWEHTTFSSLQEGDIANLEFDIIGKYVKRLLASRMK